MSSFLSLRSVGLFKSKPITTEDVINHINKRYRNWFITDGEVNEAAIKNTALNYLAYIAELNARIQKIKRSYPLPTDRIDEATLSNHIQNREQPVSKGPLITFKR